MNASCEHFFLQILARMCQWSMQSEPHDPSFGKRRMNRPLQEECCVFRVRGGVDHDVELALRNAVTTDKLRS